MRFSCEGCSAKYMISDDKVGPGGVKVRCKKCGHVTLVRRRRAGGRRPARGGALAAEWWVAIADQPVGPVGIEVVQHHWDQGEIGPESLVWYAGLAEWTPARPRCPSCTPTWAGASRWRPRRGRQRPPRPPAPAPASRRPTSEWRPGAASALAGAGGSTESRDVDFSATAPASADRMRRQPPRHFRPRATSSGPTPPGSCPCPWPGWSGPERSESPVTSGDARPARSRHGPGAQGEPLAHRGAAGRAGGRGGRRRPASGG